MALGTLLLGGCTTRSASPTRHTATPAGEDRLDVHFTGAGLTGSYHVWASRLDRSSPVGLLLWLHGDGAYEFEHPASDYCLGGSKGVVELARRRNLVVVAAQTPDTEAMTWWEEGPANASYAVALVDHLVAQHGVEQSRLWLAGYSGGAQLLTQSLLPAHPAVLAAGAVMFGGGGVPEVPARAFTRAQLSRSRLAWVVGRGDITENSDEGFGGLDEAQQGHRWYGRRGFARRTLQVLPDTTHDLDGRFGTLLAPVLDG